MRMARRKTEDEPEIDVDEVPPVKWKPTDICSCGHYYSEHRMLCDCPGRETECGHAVDERDTDCFHREDGKFCRCEHFRKARRR